MVSFSLFALLLRSRALDRVERSAEAERDRGTEQAVARLWSVNVVDELRGVVPDLQELNKNRNTIPC